jgi:hypothetical protein
LEKINGSVITTLIVMRTKKGQQTFLSVDLGGEPKAIGFLNSFENFVEPLWGQTLLEMRLAWILSVLAISTLKQIIA